MISFSNEGIGGELAKDTFAWRLVCAGMLMQDEVVQVLLAARREKLSLVGYLAEQRRVGCRIMAEQLAEHLGLQWFDLSQIAEGGLLREVVDEQFIQLHRVLPLYVERGELYLAIAEQEQLEVIGEIKFHTDLNVVPVVVEWDKLSRLIDSYLSERQYRALSHAESVATGVSEHDDERIMQVVQEILLDAVKRGASDIHLEPYTTAYRMRLRIDGILHKVAQIPLDLALRATARLKILARLDIAERRLPQDGRFSIEMNSQEHRDCRISTCPTLFGEKTVVRILDGSKTVLNLDDLGMLPEQKTLFINSIHKPQGMLLVTGPTGSGKTVTLYTALSLLNTLDKNISTAEEPIEVQLPGINQVHINTKVDLTFSKVLRAFLRQDPDIIMVGEIRDKETADMAMKAAQTGHLVLSTLHANSAAETISRLLMMGIAAFNIIHSLHMIIAQRLVRKLCKYCRSEQTISLETLLESGFDKQMLQQCKAYYDKDYVGKESETHSIDKKSVQFRVYNPVGCEQCTKGYKGRVGIFEILPITVEIENIIINDGAATDIAAAAGYRGMINLREASLRQLLCGVTSFSGNPASYIIKVALNKSLTLSNFHVC